MHSKVFLSIIGAMVISTSAHAAIISASVEAGACKKSAGGGERYISCEVNRPIVDYAAATADFDAQFYYGGGMLDVHALGGGYASGTMTFIRQSGLLIEGEKGTSGTFTFLIDHSLRGSAVSNCVLWVNGIEYHTTNGPCSPAGGITLPFGEPIWFGVTLTISIEAFSGESGSAQVNYDLFRIRSTDGTLYAMETVPEPSTFLFAGAGITALLIKRRKR